MITIKSMKGEPNKGVIFFLNKAPEGTLKSTLWDVHLILQLDCGISSSKHTVNVNLFPIWTFLPSHKACRKNKTEPFRKQNHK